MQSDRADLIRYKINLRKYLAELSCYFGREIREADLVSPAESRLLIAQARCDAPNVQDFHKRFTMLFAEKSSRRFREFLERLHTACEGDKAYAWTRRSDVCGLCHIQSVSEIDPDFSYECDENGLLVIYSSRLSDRVAFDFSETSSGQRVLEIEASGRWASVDY